MIACHPTATASEIAAGVHSLHMGGVGNGMSLSIVSNNPTEMHPTVISHPALFTFCHKVSVSGSQNDSAHVFLTFSYFCLLRGINREGATPSPSEAPMVLHIIYMYITKTEELWINSERQTVWTTQGLSWTTIWKDQRTVLQRASDSASQFYSDLSIHELEDMGIIWALAAHRRWNFPAGS